VKGRAGARRRESRRGSGSAMTSVAEVVVRCVNEVVMRNL
jgi:hypothetical protein